MTALFRSEVIQAQQAQSLGEVLVVRNPRFTTCAIASVCIGAALVIFAAWGGLARKATVPGLLAPQTGSVLVTSPIAGVISERRVSDGDAVQADQALFVVASDRLTHEGHAASLIEQGIQQRRQAFEDERQTRDRNAIHRIQAISRRVKSLAAEQEHAKREVELAQARVELAIKGAERFRELAVVGYVSELQAQQKAEELLDLRSKAQATMRNVQAFDREMQSLKAEQDEIEHTRQTEMAQIARSISTLEQEHIENEARKGLVIGAAESGVVTAVHLPLGAAVQAGQALATLVPNSTAQANLLEAQLYAPSRTAGFLAAGQSVWLRYAAYPYQKFGMARGEVVSISQTPINPQDLPYGQANALLGAAQTTEPLYRTTVRLESQNISVYGQATPLKPGMALEADVMQETRSIWEWLFEPLIAARHRASPATSIR